LSRLDQRVVIITDIADAVAFARPLRVLPFTTLNVIFRIGKRWYCATIPVDGVPSTVIEVQMRVDDDIDFFWSDTHGVQAVQQLLFGRVDLLHTLAKLVADAGLDQHGLCGAAHKYGV